MNITMVFRPDPNCPCKKVCTEKGTCADHDYRIDACGHAKYNLFTQAPDPVMQQELIGRTTNDFNRIQEAVFGWAESVFPDRTDASMFLKIYKEIAELIDAQDDPIKVADEIADLMIMLLDYAKRKGVVNIGTATLMKLEVNKTRTWRKTNMGNYQHVK